MSDVIVTCMLSYLAIGAVIWALLFSSGAFGNLAPEGWSRPEIIHLNVVIVLCWPMVLISLLMWRRFP